MIQRIRVILTSVVTIITVTAAAAQEIAAQLLDTAPPVAEWSTRAAVVLLGILSVIRRVTPVLPQEYGILPVTDDN